MEGALSAAEAELADLFSSSAWRDYARTRLRQRVEAATKRLLATEPQSPDEAYRLLLSERARLSEWQKMLADPVRYFVPETER